MSTPVVAAVGGLGRPRRTPSNRQTQTLVRPSADNYLTVEEVCKKLRLGRSTVYDRIHAGLLPVTDLGTDKKPKLRVAASALDAFLEARTVGPTPAAAQAGE